MFLSLFLVVLIFGVLVFGLPRLLTSQQARGRVYSIEQVPPQPVAIVFGAGLWRDGSPSPVLSDRVQTAAQLYFAGKVQKLLLSGDNRFVHYNEPEAMRQYALRLGVPDNVLVLDYAGRRTYDTCYRARDIFGVRQAILVTQKFHLPRALYTCNMLNIQAVGVPADLQVYHPLAELRWQVRELPATLVALWEVHVTHPEPVLGEPEPIFSSEAE